MLWDISHIKLGFCFLSDAAKERSFGPNSDSPSLQPEMPIEKPPRHNVPAGRKTTEEEKIALLCLHVRPLLDPAADFENQDLQGLANLPDYATTNQTLWVVVNTSFTDFYRS